MSTETEPDLGLNDGANSHRRRNRFVRRGLFVCAAITVLTTLAIFWVLLNEATHFFFDRRFTGIVTSLLTGGDIAQRISFYEFFFGGERWDPSHSINPGFWVVPLLWGTLMITVGAALVSIPIGTLTALYLSEYASDRVRQYLKPALEVLAGIPTIVYGFFAISFITPWLIQPIAEVFGQQTRATNAIAGAVVVGIMTIPIVASISEDAMNAVPDELRNGAYALGATRYQVSTQVVLPASVSGVFAGYILAISRAVGETMAVVLAAGFTPQVTLNPFDEIQTMTAYMVDAARGEAVVGSIRYQSLFAIGLALFLMTLALNLLNDWVKRRYREEYQ